MMGLDMNNLTPSPQSSCNSSFGSESGRKLMNSSSSSITALVPGGVVTTQNISTVIRPKGNNNSLQFVKIQTPELSKKAVEQIKLAEDSKISKEKIKEVEEDWQNNLLNWKSKRRQQFNFAVDNESGNPLDTSADSNGGRKIKTFAEMIEQRAKSGNRLGFHLQRYISADEDDEDNSTTVPATHDTSKDCTDGEADQSEVEEKQDIDWLAIYDVNEQENYGSVIIPSHLSVPPSLVSLVKYESRLPQCEQLHRDIQLNWEIFGPQITIELVARISNTDYIGFGISGSENSSQMIGADVSISYLEAHLGYTFDYNITDRHPCVSLQNNEFRGVCQDTKIGGVENYQIHTYTRENGLTKITFRRNLLNTGDEGDKVYKTTGSTYIIWAVGKLNKFKEPRYHHMYSKGDVKIEFGRKITKNCFQFTVPSHDPTLNANDAAFSRQQVAALSTQAALNQPNERKSPLNFLSHFSHSPTQSANNNQQQQQQPQQESPLAPFYNSGTWGQPVILNKTATVFYARLGHPGVRKGYVQMTGEGSPGLVWYINGLMSPILHVQRGKTYIFRIEGGDSYDKNYRFYHPFYITDEPFGGYLLQNVTQRNHQKVFAGLQFEKAPGQVIKPTNGKPQQAEQPKMIGKPATTSVGRLCSWLPNNINDIRKAETHQSFAQFRAKLNYNCLPGQPGIVQWTPNVSTPDVVYYQSYTQRNMGWKIIVRDDSDGESAY